MALYANSTATWIAGGEGGRRVEAAQTDTHTHRQTDRQLQWADLVTACCSTRSQAASCYGSVYALEGSSKPESRRQPPARCCAKTSPLTLIRRRRLPERVNTEDDANRLLFFPFLPLCFFCFSQSRNGCDAKTNMFPSLHLSLAAAAAGEAAAAAA